MLLELWGHGVANTPTGPTASSARSLGRPDVALIDIGLPGLNGYEVARRIRAACPDRRDRA